MINQDFLQRMIEQLALVLAEISRLTRTQQYAQAFTAVEQALNQIAGLGLVSLRFLRPDDILARLMRTDDDADGRERAFATALLLQEAGGICLLQDRLAEHCELNVKSLDLTLRAALTSKSMALPEHAPKIDDLIASLTACHVPAETRLLLVRFFERGGQFAKAEDALFDALETHPEDGTIVDTGVAFYKRLLLLDDVTLVKGNLPRDEVQDGLLELQEG